MPKGVVHVQWYATIGRGDMLVQGVSEMAAPAALLYGATHYSVQRSRDDRFKIIMQTWFNSSDDWYRYWEGPEMREFRARYSGKFQAPLTYTWHDEYAAESAPAEPVGEATTPDPEPSVAV
jgi:hypothetical protein